MVIIYEYISINNYCIPSKRCVDDIPIIFSSFYDSNVWSWIHMWSGFVLPTLSLLLVGHEVHVGCCSTFLFLSIQHRLYGENSTTDLIKETTNHVPNFRLYHFSSLWIVSRISVNPLMRTNNVVWWYSK